MALHLMLPPCVHVSFSQVLLLFMSAWTLWYLLVLFGIIVAHATDVMVHVLLHSAGVGAALCWCGCCICYCCRSQ